MSAYIYSFNFFSHSSWKAKNNEYPFFVYLPISNVHQRENKANGIRHMEREMPMQDKTTYEKGAKNEPNSTRWSMLRDGMVKLAIILKKCLILSIIAIIWTSVWYLWMCWLNSVWFFTYTALSNGKFEPNLKIVKKRKNLISVLYDKIMFSLQRNIIYSNRCILLFTVDWRRA